MEGTSWTVFLTALIFNLHECFLLVQKDESASYIKSSLRYSLICLVVVSCSSTQPQTSAQYQTSTVSSHPLTFDFDFRVYCLVLLCRVSFLGSTLLGLTYCFSVHPVGCWSGTVNKKSFNLINSFVVEMIFFQEYCTSRLTSFQASLVTKSGISPGKERALEVTGNTAKDGLEKCIVSDL